MMLERPHVVDIIIVAYRSKKVACGHSCHTQAVSAGLIGHCKGAWITPAQEFVEPAPKTPTT